MYEEIRQLKTQNKINTSRREKAKTKNQGPEQWRNHNNIIEYITDDLTEQDSQNCPSILTRDRINSTT